MTSILNSFQSRPWMMPIVFLCATFFVSLSPLANIQFPNFLLIHTFVEIFSVALSLMVFVIYWATRNKNMTTQGVVLSFAFLGIAIADTFHITAFKGMPHFFKNSGTGTAIYFWFVARFFQSTAFFAVAFLKPRNVSQNALWLSTILGLIIPFALLFYIANYSESLPDVFHGTYGLTSFKIIIELAFSFISLSAAILFLSRGEDAADFIDRKRMATSSLYLAVMGVGFTLYKNPHDFMNLWGHVLKLISYSYLYQSIIYNKIITPYERIDLIRKELDLKIENIKLLEEELERSRKIASLGAEVRGMSHDLNNVLMIINNAANGILKIEEVKSNDIVIRKIDQIKKASLKSQEFLKSLLNFSKNVSVERQEICLSKSLHEFRKLIHPLLPANISLNILTHDNLCVFLRRTDLEQLLFNLVLNARDALDDCNGTIMVKAYHHLQNERIDFLHYHIPAGEYVCLSVEDNGSGIAPEHMEKIFEPFFTTKAKGKGTGVGLPTVVSIVQKNNGYLKVDSRPGQGTSFTLYFINSSAALEEQATTAA